MTVGKLHTGSGAGGLMNYLTGDKDHNGDERPRADIIGGTMVGETARDITREFEAFHNLRPTLGKHVTHMSINFHEDDRELTDEEQAEIGKMWAEGMGHDGYTVVSHGDHIHVAASRIKLDGSVVSDSHNFRRSEELIRKIEERFDLVKVESSHLLEPEKAISHRTAPGQAEFAAAARGEPLIKMELQNLLDELLKEPITASEFVERLESEIVGVDVRPNLASTGKLNGFSYGYGDTSWTAKELGRGYTLGNMKKKGFEYEQDRDFERLRESAERSKEREHLRSSGRAESREPGNSERVRSGNGNEPDAKRDRDDNAGRDRTGGVASVRSPGQADARERVPGEDNASPGPEASEAPGRDSPISEPAERTSKNTSPEAGGGDQEVRNSHEGSIGEPTSKGTTPAPSGGRSGSGRSSGGSGNSTAQSGANVPVGDILDVEGGWDALMAFFRKWSAAMRKANPNQPIPSPPSYSPEPGSAYDRILNHAGTGQYKIREKKIAEQLSSFGCSKFEVQAIPPKGSEKRVDRLHTTDIAGVMKLRSYFGAKNMDGYDIYVRPAPVKIDGENFGQPYVFIDDLSASQVSKLTKAGLPLAVKVESSPGNFHGWIRTSSQPMPAKELTAAAQLIAKTVGGDPGAADWRHFGRLAGYTNQKPSRRTANGQQPFVKIWGDDSHLVAKNGPALMSAARQIIRDEEAAHAEKARQINERQTQNRLRQQLEGRDVFADVAEARERLRKGPDESATDLSAAMSALRKGHDPQEVKDALRAISPDLETRHPDVDRYLDRTIDAAEEKLGDRTTGYRR